MTTTTTKARAIVLKALLERLALEKLVSAKELKRLQVLKALEVEELYQF